MDHIEPQYDVQELVELVADNSDRLNDYQLDFMMEMLERCATRTEITERQSRYLATMVTKMRWWRRVQLQRRLSS
jgi:hypothetical protein